jgi:DNA replication protein DnaC
VAVTRALIDRCVSAVIVNVPMLLLTFRGTFSGDRPERFDRMLDLLCRCEHLVLDDLGRERPTPWAQETLYLVVNARYQECLATSLTTNLNPSSCGRAWGSRSSTGSQRPTRATGASGPLTGGDRLHDDAHRV